MEKYHPVRVQVGDDPDWFAGNSLYLRATGPRGQMTTADDVEKIVVWFRNYLYRRLYALDGEVA